MKDGVSDIINVLRSERNGQYFEFVTYGISAGVAAFGAYKISSYVYNRERDS